MGLSSYFIFQYILRCTLLNGLSVDYFTKILNVLLIFFAVYMGLKQGWAMTSGKVEMLDLFGKWDVGKSAVRAIGIVTMLSAALILIPQTFFWGNFLMAVGILLILCFQLSDQNLKGAAIELPFMLLNLIIIYLQYPLRDTL